MRAALLAWYADHRRALPWRELSDPYAIWVSEVMLQQTQVTTARPYYERWMAAFPTLPALAAASPEEVLRLWQGLGYYARARHLHAAARRVASELGGHLPRTAAGLRRLPGLGDYSAGAIASIAFGEAVPAVDANAGRVLARLTAVAAPAGSAALRARLRSAAAALVDGPVPGDLNQALIELGATVCTPANPACPHCPVATWCRAHAMGRELDFPPRRPRARPRSEHRFAYLLRAPGEARLLLARRPEAGLLGGLWEAPMLAAEPGEDPVELAAASLGLVVAAARAGPPLRHAFTHLQLEVTPVQGWTADTDTGTMDGGERVGAGYDAWRWAGAADLVALPMSALMRKLLQVDADLGAGAAPS